MREFIFRAWTKKGPHKHRMLYQMEPDPDGHVTFQPQKGVTIYYTYDDIFYEGECVPMQYTGMQDGSGKEIYEGDVVRCKHGITGVIKYDDHHEGGGRFWPTNHRTNSFCEIFSDKERWYYLEVIGNIYENPDLEDK